MDISPKNIYKWLVNTSKDALHYVSREMKMKTTVRYHFAPSRMDIIKKINNSSIEKDVEKLKSSNTTVGNVKWYTH